MTREAGKLLQGSADVLILKTLAGGPAHGYAISRTIHERTEGTIKLKEAGLYQALHRLEARGWIKAEWGLSENKRRAKYYQLTAKGRRHLEGAAAASLQHAKAIVRMLIS